MFSPKEILAAKLSGAGIRVTLQYFSNVMLISKTIAMSPRYDEIPDCHSILDDSITSHSRTRPSINKKNFIDEIVGSGFNKEGIGDENFAKRMYRQFIKGYNGGLAERGLDEKRFPITYKKYFFLCKSQEFTESLNNLVEEYLNCKLGDLDSQRAIFNKIKNEVKIIANDLHLSLTIEKDAVDTYYLRPLLRKEKMDKAVKGIYKTKEMIDKELAEHLAKIEADKANQQML
jgi:hypothetical protein